jgi:hypothetical protein
MVAYEVIYILNSLWNLTRSYTCLNSMGICNSMLILRTFVCPSPLCFKFFGLFIFNVVRLVQLGYVYVVQLIQSQVLFSCFITFVNGKNFVPYVM